MTLQFINRINNINNFTDNPTYIFIFWFISIISFSISFGLQLFNDKLCNFLGEIIRVIHHFSLFFIYFGWAAPQKSLIYLFIFNIIALLSWTLTNNKCILTVNENNICHLPKKRRFHDFFYFFPVSNLEKLNLKFRVTMILAALSIIILRLYANYTVKRVQIQAHAGGAKECLFPDNTISAFNYGLKTKVDVLEMDINITKDKKLIVYHDRYINHVLCKDLTLKQVKEYNQKAEKSENTEKIPTFEELFDFIQASNYENKNTIGFNIEIKTEPEIDTDSEVNEFAKLLIDAINKYNIKNKTTIQSFDKRAIKAVQILDPSIELSYLIEDPNINMVDAGKELKVQIISPDYKFLDAKKVEQLHENGIKVLPWTVDTITDIQHMLDIHVDGIITNYPKRAMDYIQTIK